VTNRITPYEAGWLTFLVKQGIASETAARAAMYRVAQEAIDELHDRKKRSRKKRKND
jgi:hypothetical protein